MLKIHTIKDFSILVKGDFHLITDSQDTALIKQSVKGAACFDGFFVEVNDGDFTAIWAFEGIIPSLNKKIKKIV